MSTAVVAGWRAQAACATADPDLFFPEPNTPTEQIRKAKKICGFCPVKEICLKDAFRRGDPDAICGGMTPGEREAVLRPDAPRKARVRRPGKASSRELAVRHGAYVLTCLVERRMGVELVADTLGSTPLAVYGAFRMLVPLRHGLVRNNKSTAIESLLATSKERLKTMERRGWTHEAIGSALNTSQSIVSASLSVLAQREEAVRRLSADGSDGLRRVQDEEIRIRRESGAGLTVADVIELAGPQIRRMCSDGIPLRQVARELGLCRESVRRAYQEMTSAKSVVRNLNLNQNQMEEAA